MLLTTAQAKIASRTACAVPSPQIGSNAIPAVPHASHPGPLSGDMMRGLEENSPAGSPIDAILPAISRLRFGIAAGKHPTESNHAVSTALGIKNSQPSSSDSIQHDVESSASRSRTGAAKAVHDPKQCSAGPSGSGRDAKIVKRSPPPDTPPNDTSSSNSPSSSCSDTTAAA